MGQQGDWDDVGGGGQFEIMTLPTGESKVRLLMDKPWFLHEHWVDVPGETGQQSRKIVCSGDESCLACKRGISAAKRNYVPVIDRADGKIKILEGGVMIFGAIKKLRKDPDYGDPTKYDLKITREGTGMTTKYGIVPSPNKSDLTKAEVALLEALPDLALYNLPMAPEEQRRIFLALDGGAGVGATSRGPETDGSPETPPAEAYGGSSAASDFFSE
jgi:hypothetical protein